MWFLLPKNRGASGQENYTHEVLANEDYLLCFDEIWTVTVLVDAAAVESGPTTLFRSTADEIVYDLTVINETLEFAIVALYNGYPPLLMHLTLKQIPQQALIPEILDNGSGLSLRVQCLASVGQIGIKWEIEPELEDLLLEGFQYILLLFVDGGLEGDELDGGDLVDAVPFWRQGWLLVHLLHEDQERGLLDFQDPQNKTTVQGLRLGAEDEGLAFLYAQ